MATVRIAAAQLNVVVGDLDGNVGRLVDAYRRAVAEGCDLVVGSELAVTGYPPEDLLLKPSFVDDNRRALAAVAEATAGHPTVMVVGFVERGSAPVLPDLRPGLFNAAAVLHDGRIVGVYRKRRLPNYAVFDEQRYFDPGTEDLALYEVAGVRLGVSICEDAWGPGGPIQAQADGGAELIVNLNASPYHRGRAVDRETMLCARAGEAGCPIVYVNQVGGQDELVFDGASLVVDAGGEVVVRAGQFVEDVYVTDIDVPARSPERRGAGQPVPAGGGLPVVAVTPAPPTRTARPTSSVPQFDPVREVYEALVLGTRDYVTKNGFEEVVIGLSGGVDSSLVATIAVDAVGPDRVHGVLMPSRYSSEHSVTDAEALSKNLGIDHRLIPIEPAHAAFTELLAPSFADRRPDLTEENLQSRIRGVLLMALSNKFGWLVLTTSNKSESAVGYSTLYGDSAGGFAVIKDVPKLLVYELCRERNARAGRELVPSSVLTKPPSAELRPDQRDDQSLPPYEELDPIVEAYVEQDRTVGDLIAAGFDADVVRRIARLIDLAEYKRRQFPPGPRVTTKAFGKDRRLPITNRYRG
jgi:NAD+ synthase (glutamine-hydrolysing)